MIAQLRTKVDLFCSCLIVLSLALWLFSCFQARISLAGGMNELGLFSILPLSFFAAFSLLIMTFFITILYGHKYRLFLLTSQTILLILFLTLTPGLIEGTARFTAA